MHPPFFTFRGFTMRSKRVRQSFFVILIVLILFTVSFILYQSCLPPIESDEKSDQVKGFFVTLFGGENTLLGAFFFKYVRKIAHFVEFFVLGAECTALILIKKSGFPLCVLPFGFAVGSLDETIQHFTGRGPSFRDVCLDFFGFFMATVFIYAINLLILRAIQSKKIRKEKEYV